MYCAPQGFTYRYNGTDRANIILTYQVGVAVDVQADKEVVAEKFEAAGMVVTDLSDNEMAKAHGRYMSGGRQKVEQSVDGATEMVYRFEFPESPGALDTFLQTLTEQGNGRCVVMMMHEQHHGRAREDADAMVEHRTSIRVSSIAARIPVFYADVRSNLVTSSHVRWSVTLFHYRNHGNDAGKVLVGLMVKESEVAVFDDFLDELGYKYEYEGNNPIYHQFLR